MILRAVCLERILHVTAHMLDPVRALLARDGAGQPFGVSSLHLVSHRVLGFGFQVPGLSRSDGVGLVGSVGA